MTTYDPNVVIPTFLGQFRFLSNFWPCPVMYDEIVYPSSEHAYVAAKTLDPKIREKVLKIRRPGEVKKFGQTLTLRAHWDLIKVDEMHNIVFDKFTRNQDLREKLLLTYPAKLEEGNWHHDNFWGVYPPETSVGENHLGKILMDVRYELQRRLYKI